MTVGIQYVGFKSKATVREYRFLLRESSIAPHEIIIYDFERGVRLDDPSSTFPRR